MALGSPLNDPSTSQGEGKVAGISDPYNHSSCYNPRLAYFGLSHDGRDNHTIVCPAINIPSTNGSLYRFVIGG
jgi:hypothetical protein